MAKKKKTQAAIEIELAEKFTDAIPNNTTIETGINAAGLVIAGLLLNSGNKSMALGVLDKLVENIKFLIGLHFDSGKI